MKFLVIDTYYLAFLESFYRQCPGLACRSYEEQRQALVDQFFGTADFYSHNLKKLRHEATEIVANCQPLQYQWAKEHGLKLSQTHWTVGKWARFIPWLRRLQDSGELRVISMHVADSDDAVHSRPNILGSR